MNPQFMIDDIDLSNYICGVEKLNNNYYYLRNDISTLNMCCAR